MRSVVVVLPASMWAMMPMLRVRSRGNSRLAIVRSLPSFGSGTLKERRLPGPPRWPGHGRPVYRRAWPQPPAPTAGPLARTSRCGPVAQRGFSGGSAAGDVVGEGSVLVFELGEPCLDDVSDRDDAGQLSGVVDDREVA